MGEREGGSRRWRRVAWGCWIALVALLAVFVVGQFRSVEYLHSGGHFRLALRSGGVLGEWTNHPSEVSTNAASAGWMVRRRIPTWWWFRCGWGAGRSIQPNTVFRVFAPAWAGIVLAAGLGAVAVRKARGGGNRTRDVCGWCGYPRAGLAEGAGCPECGRGEDTLNRGG